MQNPGDETFVEYNLARIKNFHWKVQMQVQKLQQFGEANSGQFEKKLLDAVDLASRLIQKIEDLSCVLSSLDEFKTFSSLGKV